MLAQALALHGLEGARPHMQGDKLAGDAARIELGEDLLRKMQASRRCRHRTLLAGIDGLVAVFVGSLGLPVEVRRQRNESGGSQQLAKAEAGVVPAEGDDKLPSGWRSPRATDKQAD